MIEKCRHPATTSMIRPRFNPVNSGPRAETALGMTQPRAHVWAAWSVFVIHGEVAWHTPQACTMPSLPVCLSGLPSCSTGSWESSGGIMSLCGISTSESSQVGVPRSFERVMTPVPPPAHAGAFESVAFLVGVEPTGSGKAPQQIKSFIFARLAAVKTTFSQCTTNETPIHKERICCCVMITV